MDSRQTSGIDSSPELFVGRFEILAHLGTGLVGEVYRARDTQNPNDKDGGVALKILRPGQDPSLIKSEALTLQTLWQEEEKLKDGLHAAPHLFLADPGAERPFLAMEFIRGKQIPDLLRESDARHFDEPTALIVAVQLFRILSVLHEGLNKTFIDLKMENLWWQEENGVRLRVTDWNVLEERHPIAAGKADPVLIDIFRASVSLYWMLTGELPDLQSNLKVRKLQRASNWDELSDGAKNLLSGLFLHKFATAMQARRELERLLQYWKTDVASLVSKAKEFVLNDVEKASEIVNILRKRNTQPDKDFGALENMLKETWSQRDDPTKSISLFSAGSYSAALALIENAYPHTSQPHVFHWWRQAVELTSKLESSIKKSMPDSNPDEKVERIRDIVVNSVNAYFGQKYADAEQYFSKLTHDLSDEQEIKRIYEELLDVLMGLQFYEKAENQREQASDEEAKIQRDLYKAAMENYEQARRKALTVSRDLLPEAISPASLEDSINELLNEIKVLSKVAKGKQYFKNGQVELALDTWREGFRLDPDHPGLMDFVLSVANKGVGKGALDESSRLLDIIPMSGYSFACTTLRKKINDARQKRVEHSKLSSNSEASSEVQRPLDIPKYKKANGDTTLAWSAKSPDLIRSQDMTNSAKTKVLNNKAAIKRIKSQASDRETISSKMVLTKVGEEKSLAKEIRQPQKSQIPARKQGVRSGNEARSAELESLRKAKRNELIDLERKVSINKNKTLTLDDLHRHVNTALKILHKIDPKKLDQYCVASWKHWENYSLRLSRGQELWENAQKVSLLERVEIVKELEQIGFVGKKDRFEKELGLDVLNNVKKNWGLNTIFLQSLQKLQKQYQNNPVLASYIDSETENFKKQVVERILTDSTFLSSLDSKFLRELKTQWPKDESVSLAFDKLKQVFPKKPKDWNIEHLRKLARLHPAECKEELDKYRNETFAILEYDDEIKEIDQLIEKLPTASFYALNSAYTTYTIRTVNDYKEKMQRIIDLYKLDGSSDEYAEIFQELKGSKG